MHRVMARLEAQVTDLVARCRADEAEVARLKARELELEDEVQRLKDSINASRLERAIESTAEYLNSKGERGRVSKELVLQIRQEVKACIDLLRASASSNGDR